jgi:hypothetical protein
MSNVHRTSRRLSAVPRRSSLDPTEPGDDPEISRSDPSSESFVPGADIRRIAVQLGVPPDALRALEREGVLRQLDLELTELRELLWRGHIAHVQRQRLRAVPRAENEPTGN